MNLPANDPPPLVQLLITLAIGAAFAAVVLGFCH